MTTLYLAVCGAGVCLALVRGSLVAGCLTAAAAALVRWLLVWLQGATYTGGARLDGKVAVVTGANAGIGRAVAEQLVRRGARVVMGCRDRGRAEAARQLILGNTGAGGDMVTFLHLDLASFQSVRTFARELLSQESKIDILVNNAGVAFLPSRQVTEDGQEAVMQVNHLGSFLLTNLLAAALTHEAGSRVVMVSSLAHAWPRHGLQYSDLAWARTPYSMVEVYGQSKLANILFAKEFGRRYQGAGITTYAVHPGAVITELAKDFQNKIPRFIKPVTDYLASLVLKTPEGGAQTVVYCCAEPALAGETGLYYAECRQKLPSATATSAAEAARLWEVSEKIVGDITPIQ